MDASMRIVAAVNDARAEGKQLRLSGHGSKRRFLPDVSGDLLVTTEHSGICQYDPAELVVTARAGTPIRELIGELSLHRQCLAFEPPQCFGEGTVGGMVAAGLSGPAQPWCGSVRDAVLGVEMVNGLGEPLNFGGQVMKNVAGYDVSRLLTGSFGALGVLLSVSLRVQPLQDCVTTLVFDRSADDAIYQCRALAQQYLPISATWWCDNKLWVRLSGSEAAVQSAKSSMGGDIVDGAGLWQDIRDLSHDFFKASSPDTPWRNKQQLCRLVVPPATPVLPQAESGETSLDWAMDWGGGQRWVWHEEPSVLAQYAAQHKGWLWVLGEAVELDRVQHKYMRAIKHAFDPEGVFASMMSLGSNDAD